MLVRYRGETPFCSRGREASTFGSALRRCLWLVMAQSIMINILLRLNSSIACGHSLRAPARSPGSVQDIILNLFVRYNSWLSRRIQYVVARGDASESSRLTPTALYRSRLNRVLAYVAVFYRSLYAKVWRCCPRLVNYNENQNPVNASLVSMRARLFYTSYRVVD